MENKAEFIMKNLLAGGIAGMVSKTAVAPLDRVKILLQAHNRHHERHGVLSGLRHIATHESVSALYKGNGAQMVRIFPYAATQFTAFEMYKRALKAAGFIGGASHLDKFVAGAGAGLTAVSLTYPLDTIRARLAFQIAGEHVYEGIVDAASSIVKAEGGLRALYRGFVPTLCGMVPYAGLSFYCFECLKHACSRYLPRWTCRQDQNGGHILTVPAKLLCGGFAGAAAQSVSYPLDVTRRRMQLAMMNPDTRRFAVSMRRTLLLIYQEDGVVRGLYRGMSINYLRAVPMVAVSFSTYELCKQLLHMDTSVKVESS